IQGHMPVQNLGHGHDPLRHDDHLDTEHAPAAEPPRPPGIRGAAATPEDSVGPLATISATAVDQVKPATHLGGPRLASLLLLVLHRRVSGHISIPPLTPQIWPVM